ncbi:MAG: hypothetical protein M3R38_00805 [Actinomycetota bacterium]|nr:hypothetical protein [Actinomycetota bacterium]
MRERKARALVLSREDGRFRAWKLGVPLMVASGLFLAGCGAAEEPAAEANPAETAPAANEEPESAGQAVGVSVADIVDDPEEFYGKNLTVSGLVGEVVGPNAVTIGGQDGIFEEELLIVGAQPLPELAEGDAVEIAVDDLVQATGTLQEFAVPEFEEALGTELDDNLFGEYEGEPALQAKSVALTPAEGGGTTTAMQQGIQASIPTIVDDPEEFYGSTTTLTGGVVEVVEPAVFAMSDRADAEALAGEEFGALAEEEAILVVNGTPNAPQPNLSELATVQVSGAVRELNVAEFEQEAGLELDDEALAVWEGQPAILAQEIQPTQGGGTTGQ